MHARSPVFLAPSTSFLWVAAPVPPNAVLKAVVLPSTSSLSSFSSALSLHPLPLSSRNTLAQKVRYRLKRQVTRCSLISST